MVLYNPALLHGDKFANADKDAAKPPVSEELYKQYSTISPYLSVSKDDPPGIILVGSEDGVLPTPVVKSFQEKCKAVGVRMDAVIYPGEGHSFFGIARSLDRFYDTTIEADKFLASLGWLQGPPTLTRDDVNRLAAKGPPPTPNKTKREAMKKEAAEKKAAEKEAAK
jgi:acetyl esterase/lipase